MQEDSPCTVKTRQALLIPELLRRIFELSTDWANRSNALVCKDWCEEALSVLWSDVEARQLFGLLAPMKLEGSERYFSRDLEDEDWDRFEVYSWRVRSLRFATYLLVDWDERPAPKFRQSVFDEIALGRRRVDFLPNLVALYNPPSNTRVFPLFAHASVRTLEIRLEFGGRNVGLLASRMRNIESLACVIPHDPSWSSISSALQNLQSLKELTISSGCLDLETFHTLASLPYLRSVTTCKLPADTSATSKGSKVFPSNPFPSLKELDVHIDFPTAIEWLPIASHTRALRSLKIQSPSNESGADYLHLTNLIGSTCTSLETLELERAGVGSLENAIPADKRCGLESLTNLTSLHLRAFDAPSPLEFERLLEPLPKLESLSINGGLRKTPLYSLAVISRRCKNLTNLKLDVDTAPRPVNTQPEPFGGLWTLNVGSAPMADWELIHVGHFLSRVLPMHCVITYAASMSPENLTRWAEVSKWVPVLIQSRLEGKGRSTAWDYEAGRPRRGKKGIRGRA
ncbi:F-box domain-containing protein [Pleurotus pulmonarius]